jgi:hypothetical protein
MTPSRAREWLHFLLGWIILIGFVGLARWGSRIPEGGIGGVVGNNLERGFDATPLFYSELDSMPDLEKALSEIEAP